MSNFTTPVGYEKLVNVLTEAVEQAAHGKGKERHANGLPFHQQPMQTITALAGYGFPLGQVIKKAQEAASMLTREEYQSAREELLGVIVYSAGAIIALDRHEEDEKHLRVRQAADAINHGIGRASGSEESAIREVINKMKANSA